MNDLTPYPVLLKENCYIHTQSWLGKSIAWENCFQEIPEHSKPRDQVMTKLHKKMPTVCKIVLTCSGCPGLSCKSQMCVLLSMGRLMCLWQGRQGGQHPQCLGQHWSQPCIVSKSQRGKQIGTHMPEWDMGQLRHGHIFCCPLASSVLDGCLNALLGSNRPDKKCRIKRVWKRNLSN